MKKSASIAGSLLAIVLMYLLAWPVPVEPVSWQAPENRGLVDPFESNHRLQAAVGIGLGHFEGPEDTTVGADGNIYVTTHSGHVIRIQDQRISEFAFPGGRPLGIEGSPDGSLIIANAYFGLQRVDQDGSTFNLLSEVGGEPLVYANNLAIGPDGIVYFSESSRRFGAEANVGTYEASLLDIIEHGGQGRILAFDPSTGDVEILLENLNFANGVAISADGSFLLVAETGHYRVLKHWLAGEKAGRTEVLLENLPGFPDNLKSGAQGRFWLGLAAPRNQLLDRLSANRSCARWCNDCRPPCAPGQYRLRTLLLSMATALC